VPIECFKDCIQLQSIIHSIWRFPAKPSARNLIVAPTFKAAAEQYSSNWRRMNSGGAT
jgi:6-phosphogluconate dehydrogenase